MGKKQCPNKIETLAVKKGFFVSKKYILPSFFPDLDTLLERDEKVVNIIVCEKQKGRVNETIAKLTHDEIVENVHLKKAVMDYYKSINIPVEKSAFSEWEVPKNARGIINEGTLSQGYFIKGLKESYIVVSLDNYQLMLDVVLDEIENNDYQTTTFKTFGLDSVSIKSLLGDLMRNKDGIKIGTVEDGLDVDIVLKAKSDNQKIEEYSIAILNKLSKFVYAEEDLSIFNVVFKLLSMTGQKIALAESVTGGNIASSIIKHNNGASKVIEESFVTYSNASKTNILGVNPNLIKDKGVVSSEVAYQMVQGLLNITGAQLAVATTGYASEDKAGECYIGIGDREKIHVYKNIFSGTREEIIENTTKSALFYLIKKIRSNDFIFNTTNV
jgi:nicotinamide-nucleotide amidase